MVNRPDYKPDEIAARLPSKQAIWKESWRMFRSNRPALVSLIVVIILFSVAFLGPLVWPFESAVRQTISDRLQPPSSQYWFGTDNLGRDLFSRIVNGARTSLTLGFAPTSISMFFGMLLGSAAAFFGKWVENLIMRLVDMIQCIPSVLLMLMIVAITGPGLRNAIIALSITGIPGSIRYVRALVLDISERDFIEAAKACGTKSIVIMYKHILKNAVGPLVLGFVSSISGMIMAGAALSFLGVGVQPPYPEWGFMIAGAREFLQRAPHLLFVPGIMIVIAALCFNLVGDGLRDVLDPRLRR
ncbi:MAG: ABC transporter permease [Treponema sp.]|nr:ABC transporter permease [Treponema sp.]